MPRDTLDRFRPLFRDWSDAPAALHRQWINFVLAELLEWRECFVQGPSLPPALDLVVPEHGSTVRPDFAFKATDGVGFGLLGMILSPGVQPSARVPGDRWPASPADRMAMLLRQKEVPIGLVTDGRWWSLVWAPASGVTSVATWDGAIWLEERDTLTAFRCLVERRRFLGVPDDQTLPQLLSAGLEAQEEITETLGRQVRQAVEMLVEAIGRAAGVGETTHDLLASVGPAEVYHGAVTVMMRLIFLLFAEERLLLPADHDLYSNSYSAGGLVDGLREAANLSGEEALEHRTAAWHRLLTLFRGIHSGIAHDQLRLPAYGGVVFDPDRHPWLEGRPSVALDPSEVRVLPIDDRTVLHALEAIQYVRIRGERRRLTFQTLDVEQIGYVYEGLLGYDAQRSVEPVVGLVGKEGEEAEVAIASLDKLIKNLASLEELTGLSRRRLDQALSPIAEHHEERERLLRAAGADEALVERLLPIFGLIRRDLRGLPVLIRPGGLYVTVSPRRRLSGTHYTPRELAERVVVGALEALVYSPGPLESADRKKWSLKASSQILRLRVADIAMGSGAFLVAACRYLGDRLVEAWAAEGNVAAVERLEQSHEPNVGIDGDPVIVDARRLIIEHCLYGGDINEMAVEMAKLSLWLVSLSRERPFSFLDDRLVCGDSIIGLTSTEQLETMHLDPRRARERAGERGFDLWGTVRSTLEGAEKLRRAISAHPLRDVRDTQEKARMLAQTQELTQPLSTIADALVGASMASSGSQEVDIELLQVASRASAALRQDDPLRQSDQLAELTATAAYQLDTDRPPGAFERKPTHWPLAFPEVFAAGGFDAVIGNPPFLGGKRISGALGGAYREFLVRTVAGGVRGNADLVAYFALVAHAILNSGGQAGLISTNTLAQGDTREVGLDRLTESGISIRAAVKSAKWPTRTVNLEYAVIWTSRQPAARGVEAVLDGLPVRQITSSLDSAGRVQGAPFRLVANAGLAFIGSFVLGLGFIVKPEEAQALIQQDPRNRDVLFPYLNGEDLNQRSDGGTTRWIINFHDWPLEHAQEYPDCLEIVRLRVKPQRDLLPDYKARVRSAWWRYEYEARPLYSAIRTMRRVLVIARISKTASPIFVATGMVMNEKTVAFAYDDDGYAALLSSSFHQAWAIAHSSTLRADLQYTPTDCFETFVRPTVTDAMRTAGEALTSSRTRIMRDRQLGLTSLYNLVHDRAVTDVLVDEIRRIHIAIDTATAAAYDWSDLVLNHDFYDTHQGRRFTVSKAARTELLDRLTELNHKVHDEEEARGISRAAGPGRRARSRIATQPELLR